MYNHFTFLTLILYLCHQHKLTHNKMLLMNTGRREFSVCMKGFCRHVAGSRNVGECVSVIVIGQLI